MSDSEVIKEFLVSLGFKTDTESLSRFAATLGSVGKTVGVFAAAAATSAAAIVGLTTKVSESLDDLYWAGQRIHASVSNIQGFQFAIQQMGGSSQGALSSLEGLASFLRSNPGAEGFLNNLGVNTRSENGQLVDRVKIMDQLGARLKQMPFYIAKAYASFMGIDELTLMAMERGTGGMQSRFGGIYRAAGLNADAAAKGAHAFMVSVRSVEAQFTVLAEVLATRLNPLASKLVRTSSNLIQQFLHWTSTAEAADLGNSLVRLGKTGWDAASAFARLTKTVLHVLNVDSFSKLGTVVEDFAKTMNAVNDLLKGNLKGAKSKGAGVVNDIGLWAADTLSKWGLPVSSAEANHPGNRVPAAMQFFLNQGRTKAQAAAIVANLVQESGLNPRATGDSGKAYGVAQWHHARQEQFKKVFGHDIRQSTMSEQLAFVQWELTHTHRRAGEALRRARDAWHGAGIVSDQYEGPKNKLFNEITRGNLANQILADTKIAPRTRGGSGATINQKNDFHFSGLNYDARAFGKEAESGLNRANSDILRQLRTASQ